MLQFRATFYLLCFASKCKFYIHLVRYTFTWKTKIIQKLPQTITMVEESPYMYCLSCKDAPRRKNLNKDVGYYFDSQPNGHCHYLVYVLVERLIRIVVSGLKQQTCLFFSGYHTYQYSFSVKEFTNEMLFVCFRLNFDVLFCLVVY